MKESLITRNLRHMNMKARIINRFRSDSNIVIAYRDGGYAIDFYNKKGKFITTLWKNLTPDKVNIYLDYSLRRCFRKLRRVK